MNTKNGAISRILKSSRSFGENIAQNIGFRISRIDTTSEIEAYNNR